MLCRYSPYALGSLLSPFSDTQVSRSAPRVRSLSVESKSHVINSSNQIRVSNKSTAQEVQFRAAGNAEDDASSWDRWNRSQVFLQSVHAGHKANKSGLGVDETFMIQGGMHPHLFLVQIVSVSYIILYCTYSKFAPFSARTADPQVKEGVYRSQEAPFLLQSTTAPDPSGKETPTLPPWIDLKVDKLVPRGLKQTGPSETDLPHRDEARRTDLHHEIQQFASYITDLNAAGQHIIENVISKLTSIVRLLWDTAELKMFGSYATNLWLPSSDLDLVIIGANSLHHTKSSGKGGSSAISELGRPASMGGVRSALHWLACELGKRKWVQSVRVIHNTKVPVIKLIVNMQETKVLVDITYCSDQEESSSHHTGLLSNHLIRHYISVLPELRPLALVLKQLLYEKGLSNTYTGGLSSYCLILMLVAFLQSQRQVEQQAERQSIRAVSGSIFSPQGISRHISGSRNFDGQRSTAIIRHQDLEDFRAPATGTGKLRRRHSLSLSNPSSPSNVTPALQATATVRKFFIEGDTYQRHDQHSSSHLEPHDASTRRSDGSSPKEAGSKPLARDLGKLLSGFLEFYGRHFDYRKVGIAPQLHNEVRGPAGCYYSLHAAVTTLVISDPLDPHTSVDPTRANNIGRGVFAMYRVKAAFDYALSILSASRDSPCSFLYRIFDGPPPKYPMQRVTDSSAAKCNITINAVIACAAVSTVAVSTTNNTAGDIITANISTYNTTNDTHVTTIDASTDVPTDTIADNAADTADNDRTTDTSASMNGVIGISKEYEHS